MGSRVWNNGVRWEWYEKHFDHYLSQNQKITKAGLSKYFESIGKPVRPMQLKSAFDRYRTLNDLVAKMNGSVVLYYYSEYPLSAKKWARKKWLQSAS